MSQRLSENGDLWQSMSDQRVSLRAALPALEQMLSEDDWKEALAASTRRPTSRKKRNSTGHM